jgi:hypothetical protein
MADPRLRAAGAVMLALGVLALAVSILTNSISTQSPATSVAIGVGVPFLVVGTVAWILGRVGRVSSPDPANPRLRRWGFLLLAIGLFAGVAGLVGVALTHVGTLPRDETQAVATAGLWVAIAGTVMVALSSRERSRATASAVSER